VIAQAVGVGIRGSQALRCRCCGLHQASCLCDELPRLACATRVVLFQHRLDAARPSNTARLVTAMIEGAIAMLVGTPRGTPTWRPPPGRRALMLHPDGRPLVPEDRQTEPYLLVPDGTWSQVRRMIQRVPALVDAEMVSVTVPLPSGPALRRRAAPDKSCTLEAVAVALGILEAPAIESAMLAAHRALVERALAVRNVVP
jgi:tRNA-uridine aminocarboxypropyltransferase